MADEEAKSAMLSLSDYENYPDQDEQLNTFSMNNIILDFGECGFRCIRSSFFLFNLFFWTASLTIILLGIWLNLTRQDAAVDYASFSGIQIYTQGPNYLLMIGVLTLFLTFMGCCGIRWNSICLLSCYAATLLIILAFQLAAVGLTYVYKRKVETTLKNEFKLTFHHYGETGQERLSTVLDSLQKSFQCCGPDGYVDWKSVNWGRDNANSVPITCCRLPHTPSCNTNISSDSKSINTGGCFNHLRKYFLENLHIISGFGVWIVVMETLGVLFAIIFLIKIRKERRSIRGEGSTYYEMTERYCKDE